MATTYTGPKVAAGVQEREFTGGVMTVTGTYDIATGSAFVINDVVQMVKVPYGAKVTDVTVTVPALDSSTGIVWAVGDGNTADLYITGATTGRSGAGGVVRMNNTGQGTVYAADDTIDLKVTTAATGTAVTTGTITMTVTYSLN